MDGFKKVFQYIPEYRISVCRTYRFVVVLDHVRTHLQGRYLAIPTYLRRSITEIYNGLSDVTRSIEEVVFPTSREERILGLLCYRDRMRCIAVDDLGTQCTYICRGKTFGI